jgi:hypothetical protein
LKHLTEGTPEERALAAAAWEAIVADTLGEHRLMTPRSEDVQATPLSETLPYLVLRAGRLI